MTGSWDFYSEQGLKRSSEKVDGEKYLNIPLTCPSSPWIKSDGATRVTIKNPWTTYIIEVGDTFSAQTFKCALL